MSVKRCDRCEQLSDLMVRNRGEDLCWSCMDAEMRTCGVNIRVTSNNGAYSFVYNTVRDRDKAWPRLPWWCGDGRDRLVTKTGRVRRPGSRRRP